MSSKVESGLACIELKENVRPLELFTEWMEEYKTCSGARLTSFNLAVASLSGEIANCTISLVELQKDGFIFATKRNSRKAKFIVRMQGTAKELSKEDCESIYQRLPTYCKIRDIICDQGEEVHWEDLKMKHDELLEKCRRGMELKMPDSLVAYKIVPKVFDFYYSSNSTIADRILFRRECCKWKHKRVCA
nr:unnamed protein product [Callosobruchus chinensis]